MLRNSLLCLLGLCLTFSCKKQKDISDVEKPSIALELESNVDSPHSAYVKTSATLTGLTGYDSLGVFIDTQPNPGQSKMDAHGKFPLMRSASWAWTNLVPNTTYYVRAVIYGNMGAIYSNEISFTTTAYFTAKLEFLNKEVMVFDSAINLIQAWSTQNSLIGANSVSDGKSNTQQIAMQNADGAAKYCETLVYAGYSDWYLPASEEMQQLAMTSSNHMKLYANAYWTSTEKEENRAVALYRNYSNDPWTLQALDKIKQFNMVCIREK